MALLCARMAGLELPEKPFDLARRWLDFAGGGEHGGLYGYQSPSDISSHGSDRNVLSST